MGPQAAAMARPRAGIREQLSDWLFQQGVSTVLLFAILAGGMYAARVMVPAHIESIKDGYQKIEDSHRKEREDYLKSMVEQRDKDREVRKADLEFQRRMFDVVVGKQGAAVE